MRDAVKRVSAPPHSRSIHVQTVRFRVWARESTPHARRVLALTALAGTFSSGCAEPSGKARPVSPNIVLIEADGATFDRLTPAIMPRTERLLGRGGTTFADYATTTPSAARPELR